MLGLLSQKISLNFLSSRPICLSGRPMLCTYDRLMDVTSSDVTPSDVIS